MAPEPDRYAHFRRGSRGRAPSFADMVPAEFRPKRETGDDPVTRIIVYVEREKSGGMEYDWVHPSDVQLSPGLAMVAPHRAGAKLSLEFTASPRPQDTRIWTRWNTSRNLALNAAIDLAEALGYELRPAPGLRSGPEAAVRATVEDGDGRAGGDPGVRPDRTGGRERAGDHRMLAGTVDADDAGERSGGGAAAGDGGPGQA